MRIEFLRALMRAAYYPSIIPRTKMSSNSHSADLFEMMRSIIPKLDPNLHKGEAGRIGVVGGCREYTGAPYFAAISALKVGCDLSHVFCMSDAASVIKAYSPELIVHPVLDARNAVSEISQWLERIHALIIGPGLGRDEKIFENIKGVIAGALELDIPLVIDADGLFYVTQYPELVKGHPKITLTPNAAEFSRLYFALTGSQPPRDGGSESVMKISELLGNVTIVQKGKKDVISDGKNVVECDHQGSNRRCGGQGDLLSGSLGAWLYWASKTCAKSDVHPLLKKYGPSMCAAYSACWLTRECNRLAFEKNRRSTTTSDMIQEIGTVMIGVEEI